ncbi:hypothetical protein K435DRAFT_965232, partial [Dendrothele bispora CBS 962.96]
MTMPKRRKLSSSPILKPANPQYGITPDQTKCSAPRLSCVSCRRVFNVSKSTLGLVLCARCTSPTCLICSRTCTTQSPPPPPLPSSNEPLTKQNSPRRSALSMNSLNLNTDTNAHTRTNALNTSTNSVESRGKRKTLKDNEDDISDSERNPNYNHNRGDKVANDRDRNTSHMHGCGRTVCKNCCFENVASDTTTCYDCCL